MELKAHNFFIDEQGVCRTLMYRNQDSIIPQYFSQLDRTGPSPWGYPSDDWEIIPFFVWDCDSPDFLEGLAHVRELLI